MSRTAFASAVVVAVVAVASLALWMNQSDARPAAGSTPSPSTAAPSTAAGSPSPSASASLPVGVAAPGAILFERHDKASNLTTLHAISPDGTGDVTLGTGDACCLTVSDAALGAPLRFFLYLTCLPVPRLAPPEAECLGDGLLSSEARRQPSADRAQF